MSSTFALTTSAFAAGGEIPARYTCDGQDVSPPLAWAGAPAGTAAFALIVDDPDAGGFVHWVVAPIPAVATSLPEGVPPGGPPPQGRNGFGRIGWGGPCPPAGTHHYVFQLVALREVPSLPANPSATAVRAAIKGAVLAEARLEGTYRHR